MRILRKTDKYVTFIDSCVARFIKETGQNAYSGHIFEWCKYIVILRNHDRTHIKCDLKKHALVDRSPYNPTKKQ